MDSKKMELSNIPSPKILLDNKDVHYRDPAAIYHDGVFDLFFTVNHPRNDSILCFITQPSHPSLTSTSARVPMAWSDDLVHWNWPGKNAH